MSIAKDSEKAFNKIQQSLLKITVQKLEMKINFFNIIKGIHEKSISNIISIGKTDDFRPKI